MAVEILARLQTLRDLIAAAGVNVALDARDVNTPGVLVTGAAILPHQKLNGRDRVRATVILFAPDAGDESAYAHLDELYEKVKPALGTYLENDDATFSRIALPEGPTGLPALSLTAIVP